MADITQNPDYKLVMTFLQNITPGDMDQESAEQLMAIGQRIQNGGTLTEREREMLNSVVRAMPQMPMDPGSAVRRGEMPMDPGSAVRRGEMPMAQMPMDPGSAVRRGEMPMAQMPMDPRSAVRRGEMPMAQMPMDPRSAARQSELPSLDGMTYGPSSGVTTMDMQQMIDAGIINPNRPRPRPENLGQMRPRPRPASME
jgi:hypothetical protein